jgi:hypothetical protein
MDGTRTVIETSCDHQWQRLPLVDLAVSYRCSDCEVVRQISWLAAPGGSFEDLDRAFTAKYGGTVTGEFDPEQVMAGRALRKAAEIMGFDFDEERS